MYEALWQTGSRSITGNARIVRWAIGHQQSSGRVQAMRIWKAKSASHIRTASTAAEGYFQSQTWIEKTYSYHWLRKTGQVTGTFWTQKSPILEFLWSGPGGAVPESNLLRSLVDITVNDAVYRLLCQLDREAPSNRLDDLRSQELKGKGTRLSVHGLSP